MKTAARAVLAVWILMASSLSWGTDVAFTANVKALAGGNGNPAIGVKVQNCANYILRVPSPAVLIGDTAYLFPDGTGAVANTVPDEATISCGSTASSAYYTVSIVQWDPVKHAPILPAQRFNDYDITGASFNLNTATPRSAPAPAAIANAMLLNPAGDQTAVIPTGKKIIFSGGTVDLSGTTCIGCTGSGSGITSLNGLNGTSQTFVNETNLSISSSGTTHTLVWLSALAKNRQHAATVYNDQANVYTAGMKQTVQASASTAGLNFAGVTSDPSSPAAGDRWYRSDLNHMRFRDSASTTHSFFNSDDNLPGAQVSGNIAGNAAGLSATLGCGQFPTLTGDVTTAGGACATTLPNIVSGATFPKITFNAKGQVTAGAALVAGDIPQLAYSSLSGLPTLQYQTVKQAGSAQTQRAILNFSSGVTCSDNPGAGSTDCAVSAGGTGTVTSVTSGNFSPLFNVTVATNTTTPAFSFAVINQNQNLVYAGPSSGSAAAPTFRALVSLDIPNNAANTSGSAASFTGSLVGDVTGTQGATVLGNIPTATTAAGSIVHTNIAAPASPAAGKDSVYTDSTDLRLHDKNASGVIGTTVVADTGAANNYISAISAAGAISKSRPACATLSDSSASCATDATNAANIGSGTLPAGRMPALTGDVTTSVNTVATTIANGVVNSAKMATANIQGIKDVDIFLPTTADTNKVQIKFAQAVTLQRVSCSTDTGTLDLQFDKRAEGTPNTAGTNALTGTLQCTTSTAASTSFSSAAVAADAPLNLQISATSGTPNIVRIHVKYQIN